MNGYENLANEIVFAAYEDYLRALNILKRNPSSISAIREKEEIEAFFKNGRVIVFTSLNGEDIINYAKAQVDSGKRWKRGDYE